MEKLTKKQKDLVKELDELSDLLAIDYWKISEYEKEAKTPYLELAKDHLVRSAVVSEYTLIDENLNMLICDYFFGKKKSYIKLWKTKKFRNFNYFILEKLYLLNKLELVKEICKIPKTIISDLYKINDLRNGLVHSFFPQNLRRNKPIYKGQDIFGIEGIKLFMEDTRKIKQFFTQVIFKVDI